MDAYRLPRMYANEDDDMRLAGLDVRDLGDDALAVVLPGNGSIQSVVFRLVVVKLRV